MREKKEEKVKKGTFISISLEHKEDMEGKDGEEKEEEQVERRSGGGAMKRTFHAYLSGSLILFLLFYLKAENTDQI